MEKSKNIYMDYASATPMDQKVISKMTRVMRENFENPSAIHEGGIKVKKILDNAKEDIAKIFNIHKDEIVFTSGSTESNNLAILGVLEKSLNFFPKNSAFVPHVITTNIEHSSVLEVYKYLEKTKKAEVTYVKVESNGIIDPKKIKKEIKPNTVLISVMYANNEIGTIQPLQEIAKEIRFYKKQRQEENALTLEQKKFPLFHTDATQAINYLPINIEKLGVDLLSCNSAKIYGPKGIGLLYVKRNTPIEKTMFGGSQEFNLRPGTENIVSVVGFVEALKITEKIKAKEVKRLTILRNYFFSELEKITNFVINGDKDIRLPNNINISIPKIPSDLLVVELSAKGIYVSEKSACKSGEKAGSYVISALLPVCKKTNSLRLSLGRKTSKADIDFTLNAFSKILAKLKKWYY